MYGRQNPLEVQESLMLSKEYIAKKNLVNINNMEKESQCDHAWEKCGEDKSYSCEKCGYFARSDWYLITLIERDLSEKVQ